MKKILCVVCLIFSSSLWSQENFGLDEYQEFLKNNYKNLYNYMPGYVFLNIDYLSDRFPENLDSTSPCHTNAFEKETIIDENRGAGKYYVLKETWFETNCSNPEQNKVSEKIREIIQHDMGLPTLDMYFQAQIDKNISIRMVDNTILEFDLSEFNEKYIYDFSRPLNYIQKEKMRDGKIKDEIRQLESINLAELLPTLNGIPVYLFYLHQMGFVRKVKVSDNFLDFWTTL